MLGGQCGCGCGVGVWVWVVERDTQYHNIICMIGSCYLLMSHFSDGLHIKDIASQIVHSYTEQLTIRHLVGQ